jgi:hypothetical protein
MLICSVQIEKPQSPAAFFVQASCGLECHRSVEFSAELAFVILGRAKLLS